MDAGNEKRQSSLASVVFTERNREVVKDCIEKGEKSEIFLRGKLKDSNY